MSEASQPVEPDLHAIFGMEGEQQSAVSVERAADPFADDGAPSVEFEEDPSAEAPVENEEWAEQGGPEAAPPGDSEQGWTGITKPSRRRSSPRFLTDVIVEMQLASKRQVDDAIETSRTAGTSPERVLIDPGRSRPMRSPGRSPSATGSTTSTSASSGRHVRGEPDQHDRRQALPGGAGRVRRQAHAARRDGRPLQRARGGRHRDHDRLRDARRGRPARRHRLDQVRRGADHVFEPVEARDERGDVVGRRDRDAHLVAGHDRDVVDREHVGGVGHRDKQRALVGERDRHRLVALGDRSSRSGWPPTCRPRRRRGRGGRARSARRARGRVRRA